MQKKNIFHVSNNVYLISYNGYLSNLIAENIYSQQCQTLSQVRWIVTNFRVCIAMWSEL